MGAANRPMRKASWMRALSRWLLLLLLAVGGLQLFFVVRIVAMNWWAPESTSFQRSQAWRSVMRDGQLPWRQASVDMDAMAKPLQRAVIASEDANFTQHQGVWWQSIESAWQKNAKAKAQAEKRAQRQPDKPSIVIAGVAHFGTISHAIPPSDAQAPRFAGYHGYGIKINLSLMVEPSLWKEPRSA